ncbi:glycosyltransferase family 87 protein [Streptomyces sp. Root431]|uniref:glycosyltransferase family 87 protein n=1 Tax=Streptomyces sp. Root431 TaxID=1736535 RepID=UPI00099F284E|nr:glycosyltransferase family 87 protein [Streptomyces sp. Root431]
MSGARPLALTALVVVALAAASAHLLSGDAVGVGFLLGYAGCWAVFAAAVVALRWTPDRAVVPLVLAGAVVVAATGLVAAPRTSTDSYRYAWDGRVQAAGISPYDHAPADLALVTLRDAWLFPAAEACADGADLTPLTDGGCTRINRPAVHTIYPPVAEAWFLLVHGVSPPDSRHRAHQTGAGILSLAVTGLLLVVLRKRGEPRRAALWAWCPAVPVEAVNNAHIDVLAVLFSVAAFTLVARHRVTGGALLGLGIAVKLLPAVLLPGALSGARRPRAALAVIVPAVVMVGAVYLPYVLLSEGSVLGYLSGYAKEEGYDDADAGGRYALLRLVLPDAWAAPAVLLVMTVVALAVWRRGDPEYPWRGALLTIGTAFLLLTPGYSWYALLLVALVALGGRVEWLGVASAGAVAYLAGPETGQGPVTAAYGMAAVGVLAGAAVRHRRIPWRPAPERKQRQPGSPSRPGRRLGVGPATTSSGAESPPGSSAVPPTGLG